MQKKIWILAAVIAFNYNVQRKIVICITNFFNCNVIHNSMSITLKYQSAMFIAIFNAMFIPMVRAIFYLIFSAMFTQIFSKIVSAISSAMFIPIFSAIFNLIFIAMFTQIFSKIFSAISSVMFIPMFSAIAIFCSFRQRLLSQICHSLRSPCVCPQPSAFFILIFALSNNSCKKVFYFNRIFAQGFK